jgi:hypothetical protein
MCNAEVLVCYGWSAHALCHMVCCGDGGVLVHGRVEAIPSVVFGWNERRPFEQRTIPTQFLRPLP